MNRRFRIIRGEQVPGTSKKWGVGVTYEAESVKEAVKMDEKTQLDTAWMFGVKKCPIISVYELVPVPESEWR